MNYPTTIWNTDSVYPFHVCINISMTISRLFPCVCDCEYVFIFVSLCVNTSIASIIVYKLILVISLVSKPENRIVNYLVLCK